MLRQTTSPRPAETLWGAYSCPDGGRPSGRKVTQNVGPGRYQCGQVGMRKTPPDGIRRFGRRCPTWCDVARTCCRRSPLGLVASKIECVVDLQCGSHAAAGRDVADKPTVLTHFKLPLAAAKLALRKQDGYGRAQGPAVARWRGARSDRRCAAGELRAVASASSRPERATVSHGADVRAVTESTSGHIGHRRSEEPWR